MNDDDDLTVTSWRPDDDPTTVMGSTSAESAPARPHDDITAVMTTGPEVPLDERDRPMWQPGPRLDGRTRAPAATPPPARGGGRLVAAAIIVAAIAIAVTLWLLALWLRDDPVTAAILAM